MDQRPPGLHFNVPFEEYIADHGLNQSTLKAFGLSPTPAHFKFERDNPPEESDVIRIGRYVDALLFDLKNMDKRFALWPGERRGKAWAAFLQQHPDKTILNYPEHERAAGVYAAIMEHQDTKRLLTGCRSQVMVVAEHPKLFFRMKGLLDMLPDLDRCDSLLSDYVFDFKTAPSADPEQFSTHCWRMGYHIQAAYYMDMLEYVGRQPKVFAWIVAESKAPYEIAIHFMMRESKEIAEARKLYEAWMPRYAACLKDDIWPGYGDSWTMLKFKPWQLRHEQERPVLI